jgi:hypothetical protein
MSFREWLPITKRNRVALAFAFLGLLCAVGWNFLPWYMWSYSSAGLEWIPDDRPAGAVIWPDVISPNTYRIARFRELGLLGFLFPLASVSIALHALSALLAVFLWEMIHQAGHLKTWLGIANAVGGAAILMLRFSGVFGHVSHTLVIAVIALGMFSTAIALFTYDHEMIMRRQRALR